MSLTASSSSSTVNRPLTMRSALLSTFPWLTDFLTNQDGSLSNQEAYSQLFRRLEEFEAFVETSEDSIAVETKRALVLVDGGRSLPTEMVLNRPTGRRATELICMYRLVDVLHVLHGRKPREGNPRYVRLPVGSASSDWRAWPTHDWVTTLQNARTAMTALQAISADPNPDQPLHVRLLGDLYNIAAQNQGTKVLFNVQMAAIGLYFILQGHRTSSALSLPGFPQELADVDQLNEQLPAEQYAYLQVLMEKFNSHQRRYPTSVALLLSPLCLLVSKKLISKPISQDNLLKASKMLGNEKPGILLDIEFKFWLALLAVATGTKTAVTAVTDFLEADVPWEELKRVSTEDRNFFLSDPKSTQMKGFRLLTLQNEREVPAGWPLAYLRPGYLTTDDAADQSMSTADDDAADTSAEGASQQPAEPDEGEGGSNQDEEGPDEDERDNEETGASLDRTVPENAPPQSVDDDDGMDLDESNERVQTPPSRDDSPDDPMDECADDDNTAKRADEDNTDDPAADKVAAARGPLRPPKSRKVTTKTKSWKGKGKREESPELVTMVSGAGSALNPFQIEDFHVERDLTFEVNDAQPRVQGSKVPLFGPLGLETEWVPTFHFETDLQAFQRLAEYVEHFYINGQPRHIASPDTSHIAVIESTTYEAMSPAEVQSLLRHKHILVTGCPQKGVLFNGKGLRTLANLEAPIDIQDQSINVTDGDYGSQMCTGNLRQMLVASRSPTGPILNALSFPQPLSGVEANSMSSEIEAWQVTEGKPFCGRNLAFPTGAMRWGLAATGSGRHWIHVDSDGLGTFIEPQCGGKWWIIICSPDGQTKLAFSSINIFLKGFDTNAEPGGRWDLKTGRKDLWVAEAVYLAPGTRLIMRPNTPHAVFTTEHCISKGGHFYSTSNLQDTFYGIVHCLMANNLITNTYHLPTRYLLMRMMQYMYKCFVTESSPGHLPDLSDINSMIDVLTLCNYCILSNVLDFRTYGFHGVGEADTPSPRHRDQRDIWDRNALTMLDRQYFVYVRGLAINFIRWLGCNFDAKSAQAPSPIRFEKDFCGSYLMRQACAILNYKKKAEAEQLATIPWCKLKDIERQLQYVFYDEDDEDPWYGDWATARVKFDKHETLSFGNTDFVITRKEAPLPFTETPPNSLGLNVGDKKFRSGHAHGFPSSKSPVVPDTSQEEMVSSDLDESSGDEFRPSKRKRA